jgi:type I restriction enzyme M protein
MAKTKKTSTAKLGFEDKLWAAADKLRGNMDAAEYKHVVLGLIFLKYIFDAFMERFNQLQGQEYADPEDKDEYLGENTPWVPPEADQGRTLAGLRDTLLPKLLSGEIRVPEQILNRDRTPV